MSRIFIAYFTGTNGTLKLVEEIKKSMAQMDVSAEIFPLDLSKVISLDEADVKLRDYDRLVLAYPVYAFDAPKPVLRWLRFLPKSVGVGKKASVISVSAGGDVRSNRTSRKHAVKLLKIKQFDVDYERMVTMPSNYAETASDEINALLLKALPYTAKEIAIDIVTGREQRGKKAISPGAHIVGFFFKLMSSRFGKSLKLNDNCTDCKWCQNNCPTNNILIEDGKIKTKNKCVYCMRCVYGCPENAIQSRSMGFSVLKNGFNINDMEKRAKEIDESQVKKLGKSKVWQGAVDYLNDVFK